MTKDVQLKRKTSLKTLLSLVLSTIMIIILGITLSSLKADTANTTLDDEIQQLQALIGQAAEATTIDQDGKAATLKLKDIEDAEKEIKYYIQGIKDNKAAVTNQKNVLNNLVKARVNTRIPASDENNKTKEDVKNIVELLLVDKKQAKTDKDIEVSNEDAKLQTLTGELSSIQRKYRAETEAAKKNTLSGQYTTKQNEIKKADGTGQEKKLNDLKAEQTKLQQEQDIIQKVNDDIDLSASDAKAKDAKDLIAKHIDQLGIQETAIQGQVTALTETTHGLEAKKQALLTALNSNTYDENNASVKTAQTNYDNKIKDIQNELAKKQELHTVVNGLNTELGDKSTLAEKKEYITEITDNKKTVKDALNLLNTEIQKKTSKEDINNYLQGQLNEVTNKISQIETLEAKTELKTLLDSEDTAANANSFKTELKKFKESNNVNINSQYTVIEDAKNNLTAATVNDLEAFHHSLDKLVTKYKEENTDINKAKHDAIEVLKTLLTNEDNKNKNLQEKKQLVKDKYDLYNHQNNITNSLYTDVNKSENNTITKIKDVISKLKTPLQVTKGIINEDNKILTTNTKLQGLCSNETDLATAKALVQHLYNVANAVDTILSGTTNNNQVKKIVTDVTGTDDTQKATDLTNKLNKLVEKLEIETKNALNLEADPKTYTTKVKTIKTNQTDIYNLEQQIKQKQKEKQEAEEKAIQAQDLKDQNRLNLQEFINDFLKDDNQVKEVGTGKDQKLELGLELLTKYTDNEIAETTDKVKVPAPSLSANDVLSVLQANITDKLLTTDNIDVVIKNHKESKVNNKFQLQTPPIVTIKPQQEKSFKMNTKPIFINIYNILDKLKNKIEKIEHWGESVENRAQKIVDAINNAHKGLNLNVSDVQIIVISDSKTSEDNNKETYTLKVRILPKTNDPQLKGVKVLELTYEKPKPKAKETTKTPEEIEAEHKAELKRIEVEQKKAELARTQAETELFKRENPTSTAPGTGTKALAAGTPAAGTPAAGTPAAGTPAAGTPAAGTGTTNSTQQQAQTPATTNEPADESWTWTTWILIIVAVVGVIGTIGYIIKNKQE